MSFEKDGVIYLGFMFFEKHCLVHTIKSHLSNNLSLKYGFQGKENTLFDFKGLKDVLEANSYAHGQKIGLFVHNEKTKKREVFNIQIPPPPRVIDGDQVVKTTPDHKIDITTIIEAISE